MAARSGPVFRASTLLMVVPLATWASGVRAQCDFTFQSSVVAIEGPFQPSTPAVADIDLDGDPDMAVKARGDNPGKIIIITSDGLGNLAVQEAITVGNKPTNPELYDVDGDGDADLIVPNEFGDSVWIYHNTISGGVADFSLAQQLSLGGDPRSVAFGDFNEDGLVDMAVARRTSTSMLLLFGVGNGLFGNQTPITMVAAQKVVASAYVNGDDHIDLIVGQKKSGGELRTYLGDGTGAFPTFVSVNELRDIINLRVGEFNGDGFVDFACGDDEGGPTWVAFGDGTGAFIVADAYLPRIRRVADVDQDGDQDLLCGDALGQVFLVNDGHGTFTEGTRIDVPGDSNVPDFNDDGYPDVVVGTGDNGRRVESFINDGNCGPGCVGDINDDGFTDVFDFGILVAVFGLSEGDPAYDARADIHADGMIDVFDFSELAGDFGCGSD
jgi:hypothetical protein